jgi:endonuclease YncB( thermonuclease family)
VYEYSARLLRSISGNVADLMVDLGFGVYAQVKVQVKGIYILEGAHRQAAESYLEILLAQSPLTIRTEATSIPGRYLASVVNGAGIDVGAEMVKAGHAFPLSTEHGCD